MLVLLAGAQKLLEPMTWGLAQAVRELGPVSGWRCAQSDPYVYDPRHERPDTQLLAQLPEDLLKAVAPEVTVERVEVNLRGGDTVVWSSVGAEDEGAPRRVYVLNPGRMQAVTFEYMNYPATLCMSHMADWLIVAEHAQD